MKNKDKELKALFRWFTIEVNKVREKLEKEGHQARKGFTKIIKEYQKRLEKIFNLGDSLDVHRRNQ